MISCIYSHHTLIEEYIEPFLVLGSTQHILIYSILVEAFVYRLVEVVVVFFRTTRLSSLGL